MKRIITILIICVLLLCSCGMKGEIYLTNLQKLYPDAAITVSGEVYTVTFTDLTEVYSEDIKPKTVVIGPEHTVFTGTLSGKNSYSFDFSNEEFSNHRATVTLTVTDVLQGKVGESVTIPIPATVDTDTKTLTHGIPDTAMFVLDKDGNLLGLYS